MSEIVYVIAEQDEDFRVSPLNGCIFTCATRYADSLCGGYHGHKEIEGSGNVIVACHSPESWSNETKESNFDPDEMDIQEFIHWSLSTDKVKTPIVEEKMKRVTFNIPESLFKQLKWLSVKNNITMLEIGKEMARDYVMKEE